MHIKLRQISYRHINVRNPLVHDRARDNTTVYGENILIVFFPGRFVGGLYDASSLPKAISPNHPGRIPTPTVTDAGVGMVCEIGLHHCATGGQKATRVRKSFRRMRHTYHS